MSERTWAWVPKYPNETDAEYENRKSRMLDMLRKQTMPRVTVIPSADLSSYVPAKVTVRL